MASSKTKNRKKETSKTTKKLMLRNNKQNHSKSRTEKFSSYINELYKISTDETISGDIREDVNKLISRKETLHTSLLNSSK